ncbi:MAG: glycosyltransferase family 2 protein [Pseudomonadota bacterium]
MKKIHSLSVVIPMHREEDNVAPMLKSVHDGLANYPGAWELIVIDDGSTDDTAPRLIVEAAKYGEHVRVIRLARNHGKTVAQQVGYDAARGDLIATLDGDLQNDPADIPRMVEELDARNLDMLCGKRAQRKDTWINRKFPSKIANWLIGEVTGVHITDYGCALQVTRTAVVRRIRLYGEMHRFVPVWAAMQISPKRIGETPVRHYARQHGQSKYGISRTFRVILDLLTVFFFLRFQARPGHFFGLIGLVLGFVGSIAMSYLLVLKFGLGQSIGGRPLFLGSVVMLIFAIQFITTGVLAEMLARILHQRNDNAPMLAHDSTETPSGWKKA